MKRVLASTFEFFSRDPRAYKIDKALANKYDVKAYVRKEELSSFETPTLTFVFFKSKEPKNRFVRLFAFWRALIKYAVKYHPDIFVAHNYYLVWPAYIIKKKIRCKVIYDSYELYVPSKRNKLPKRQMFFYAIEKYCMKSFDLNVAANEERARMMKIKFNLKRRPLSVMNVSSSLFEKDNRDVISEKYPQLLQFADKIKLVYQGVLSADRELDKMIEIIKLLDVRYALIYVGDGPEKDYLQKKSEELGVANRVLLTGRVPMKDITPILAYCDYGVVSYPFDDYNNRYCAPNKIFEYPGAGLPMISSAQSTIMSVTKGYNIICFVDYNKTEEAARRIDDFVKQVTKENAQPNIRGYLKEVQWDREAEKLMKAVEEL